ncbi:hypothetical protein BCR34DRAFT_571943 [Clohesyomyces aquaticus]|uniref:Uncharacterized protein n=1 Tax=Clohesyomyces aquaticus TaxID=1231657 RepID=A0A1Y1Z5F3_9PLEO|nr:hypothetical protein BCR34DRAFT_571943 [Clohesyomyces aquaticus]
MEAIRALSALSLTPHVATPCNDTVSLDLPCKIFDGKSSPRMQTWSPRSFSCSSLRPSRLFHLCNVMRRTIPRPTASGTTHKIARRADTTSPTKTSDTELKSDNCRQPIHIIWQTSSFVPVPGRFALPHLARLQALLSCAVIQHLPHRKFNKVHSTPNNDALVHIMVVY